MLRSLLNLVATTSLAFTSIGLAGCDDRSVARDIPEKRASFVGGRGINLHNWFTWSPQSSPNQYRLPVFQKMPGELSVRELQELRHVGFDFVRLTVDPGVFMLLTGPDLEQARKTLAAAIDRINSAGLSVIVDMHPVSRVEPDPSSGRGGVKALELGPSDPVARRFQEAVASLAGALDRRYGATGKVALELLNEPDLPCGATSWRAQQAALHRAVRLAAPRLTLVLTGTCWSGIDGLTALKAADYADENLFYTFHFYDDHRFTHQGTAAEPDRSTSGLPYPWNARDRASVDSDLASRLALSSTGDPAAVRRAADKYMAQRWDAAKIGARIDEVAAWAQANHVPNSRILMGEFGVNARRGLAMGAREEDRLRWLTDVRTAAEKRGFRWAYWAYSGTTPETDAFDLLLPDHRLDPATLTALGLRHQ